MYQQDDRPATRTELIRLMCQIEYRTATDIPKERWHAMADLATTVTDTFGEITERDWRWSVSEAARGGVPVTLAMVFGLLDGARLRRDETFIQGLLTARAALAAGVRKRPGFQPSHPGGRSVDGRCTQATQDHTGPQAECIEM